MLNKKFRFHSRGGVNYVHEHGETFRVSKISLITCENQRGFTRITVVVSKKIDKAAVRRNRIRRQVYEAIRKNLDSIPLKRDYIFIVRSKDVMKLSGAELEKLLGKLVEKSKVWYDSNNGQKES